MSTVTFGLLCMCQVFFDETIPLHAKLSKDMGGLGFQSEQIGIIFAIGGVGLIVMSVVVFPCVQARYSTRQQRGPVLAHTLLSAG